MENHKSLSKKNCQQGQKLSRHFNISSQGLDIALSIITFTHHIHFMTQVLLSPTFFLDDKQPLAFLLAFEHIPHTPISEPS